MFCFEYAVKNCVCSIVLISFYAICFIEIMLLSNTSRVASRRDRILCSLGLMIILCFLGMLLVGKPLLSRSIQRFAILDVRSKVEEEQSRGTTLQPKSSNITEEPSKLARNARSSTPKPTKSPERNFEPQLTNSPTSRVALPPPKMDPSTYPCNFGVGVSVGPRYTKDGSEVEYWEHVINELPSQIEHVSVLSRLAKLIAHPRINVLHKPPVGDQPDYDPLMLNRPIKHLFNDSPERVKWRSSLTLDFARLIRYVSENCRYVLWIEDDAILPSNWFEKVNKSIPNHDHWAFDYLSQSGLVGAIFNSNHVLSLAQYVTHRFDDGPVDWTMNTWLDKYYRVQNPEIQTSRRFPVFGHRGVISTLKEASERPIIQPG